MTIKSITKMTAVLAFFVFIFAPDLSQNKAFGQTCGANADAEIVESIYAKIKGNSKLADQAAHINVTSVNQVVKLQGWADSKDDKAKIVQYAMETTCVKFVNPHEFAEAKPSEEGLRSMCTSGTKPCGDICIPENDTCNITGSGQTKNDE